MTLLVPAHEVRPLEEGEFFLHDLVGLQVETAEGQVIGRVAEVYEAGAGHFLSVVGERERLIPFSGRLVREVDVEAGRIVIEAIPGLLEI
jgi:16S rRNA processing protein RimM